MVILNSNLGKVDIGISLAFDLRYIYDTIIWIVYMPSSHIYNSFVTHLLQ